MYYCASDMGMRFNSFQYLIHSSHAMLHIRYQKYETINSTMHDNMWAYYMCVFLLLTSLLQ